MIIHSIIFIAPGFKINMLTSYIYCYSIIIKDKHMHTYGLSLFWMFYKVCSYTSIIDRWSKFPYTGVNALGNIMSYLATLIFYL